MKLEKQEIIRPRLGQPGSDTGGPLLQARVVGCGLQRAMGETRGRGLRMVFWGLRVVLLAPVVYLMARPRPGVNRKSIDQGQ